MPHNLITPRGPFSFHFGRGIGANNSERPLLSMKNQVNSPRETVNRKNSSVRCFLFSANCRAKRGFTLVELIVAMGLFALVMLLASGAYLLMIGLNRQAQGIATGIDSLSFAIETMTREVRTGTGYNCGFLGVDCSDGVSSFSFTNTDGTTVSYSCSGDSGSCSPSTPGALQETITTLSGTSVMILTDPSVAVSSLIFYVVGTAKNDGQQPHVTITVSGTVSYGAGKTESFTVEAGATMRGTDI